MLGAISLLTPHLTALLPLMNLPGADAVRLMLREQMLLFEQLETATKQELEASGPGYRWKIEAQIIKMLTMSNLKTHDWQIARRGGISMDSRVEHTLTFRLPYKHQI